MTNIFAQTCSMKSKQSGVHAKVPRPQSSKRDVHSLTVTCGLCTPCDCGVSESELSNRYGYQPFTL